MATSFEQVERSPGAGEDRCERDLARLVREHFSEEFMFKLIPHCWPKVEAAACVKANVLPCLGHCK